MFIISSNEIHMNFIILHTIYFLKCEIVDDFIQLKKDF